MCDLNYVFSTRGPASEVVDQVEDQEQELSYQMIVDVLVRDYEGSRTTCATKYCISRFSVASMIRALREENNKVFGTLRFQYNKSIK